MLHVNHLPPDLRGAGESEGERYRAPEVGDSEREAIEEALTRAGGRKAEAARMLGMGRTTLWRKLKEYGLEG